MPATLHDLDRDHARRYRALLSAARIRAIGLAGFDQASLHRIGQGENFRHLGLDMWTIHAPSETSEEERQFAAALLHEFTDHVLTLQAPGDEVQVLPNYERAFVELTDAMLAKMHRCRKDDPEELAVHHALQALLLAHGQVQIPPIQLQSTPEPA